MGILSGFLCLLCFCLLGAKALTRKCGFSKADLFLKKLHKPLSAALFLIGLVHIFFIFPLLKTRHFLVWLSGAAVFISMFLLITLCHTCRDKKRRLMQHRLLSFIMLLCILFHIGSYYMDYAAYRYAISSIHLTGIDFSHMPDGIYTGEYDAGYIYAKVLVTLSDGRIDDITLLEHEQERGKAAQQVLTVITDTQTLPVDAVTGATCSSLVLQQAVVNALTGGTTYE